MDTVLTPPEAIARWQRKELGGGALVRELVGFDQWMIPITAQAAMDMVAGEAPRISFSQDPDGTRRLLVFSSSAAWTTYRTKAGGDGSQDFLTTKGTWVFGLPLDEFDFVAIDPGCDWNVAYGREHQAMLGRTAAAISVERALADLLAGTSSGQSAIDLVCDYDAYVLAVTQAEGGVRLVPAPDDKGRALAAVFTNDDCFDAMLAKTGDGVLSLKLAGRQLFEHLSAMSIDGVVFNCFGPPRPVAFGAPVFRVFLESSPPKE